MNETRLERNITVRTEAENSLEASNSHVRVESLEWNSGEEDVERHFEIDGENQEALVAVTVDPIVEGIVIEDDDHDNVKFCRRKLCLYGVILVLSISVVSILFSVLIRPHVVSPTFSPSTFMPSAAPTTANFADFKNTLIIMTSNVGAKIIEKESGIQDNFRNKSSAQYRALKWLYYDDGAALDTPNILQRYTLAVFYYTTGGDDWLHCSQGDKVCKNRKISYLTPHVNECLWFGNKCQDGHIISLSFGTSIGNNLQGTIPSELAFLNKITFIDFTNNKLKSPLPNTIGNLTSLSSLYLYNNLFEELCDGFFHLKSLQFFSIYGNQLRGTISSKFGELTHLKILSLQLNVLTGTIPSHLSRLKNLKELYLFHNSINGTFPEEVLEIKSLERLSYANNFQLSGTLPSKIGSLPYLTEYSVSNCNLTGIIPDEYFNLTVIESFKFNSNKLYGTLSTLIGNFQSLISLELAGNNFTGSIPFQIGNIPTLRKLLLQNNSLFGEMPETICDRQRWSSRYLEIEADCAGEVPKVKCDEFCCTKCY